MSTYGFGVIDERYTKTGRKRYRVRIPDKRAKGGYITIGTYDSEPEAIAMREAGIKARQEIGIGCTLEIWGVTWLGAIAKQKGARSVRSTWGTVIADAPFYREPIDELTQLQVEDWVATLPEKLCKRSVVRDGKRVTIDTDRTLSRQMVKHALQKLQLCLDAAKKKGIVSENVARGVKLPRSVQIEDGWTYMANDEIAAALSLPCLSPLQRATFGLAIYSGLRAGELACLRWECVHIDVVPPLMEVRRSYTGGTKTGKPRVIPLLPAAVSVLRAWQPDPKKRAGLVFSAPSGGEYSPQHRWGWDERYNGNVDIPTRAGITRRVRWHDLRHTTASHLVSGSWGRAWTLKEVCEYLGHSSISQTEKYAHLAPGALAAAAADTNLSPRLTTAPARSAKGSDMITDSGNVAIGCVSTCIPNQSAWLAPDGQGVDRFTLSRRIQDAVAAGQLVADADLQTLALAVLEATREGRTAVAVLRAGNPDARLSWALDLTGIVLEAATRPAAKGAP
jgi:integrase